MSKYKPGDKLYYFEPMSSRDKYRKVPCTFLYYTKAGSVAAELEKPDGTKVKRVFSADNVEGINERG